MTQATDERSRARAARARTGAARAGALPRGGRRRGLSRELLALGLAFGVCFVSPARAQLGVMAPPSARDERARPDRATTESEAHEPVRLGWGRVAAALAPDKPWILYAELAARLLVVSDEDPANDRSVSYRAVGYWSLLEWLHLVGQVGATQHFVRVEDESGVRLQDVFLGALASQRASVDVFGAPRSLSLVHRAGAYLPTSFDSQQRDLYTALEWVTLARLALLERLGVGARGVLQYRFHRYAEAGGPAGGTLPRLLGEARVFIDYSPLLSARHGRLTVGAEVYGSESVDYAARPQSALEQTRLPAGVDASRVDTTGASASEVFSSPGYGYELYVAYAPPTRGLLASLTFEQGSGLLRHGEPRLFLFHRDEASLTLSLSGTY